MHENIFSETAAILSKLWEHSAPACNNYKETKHSMCNR